MRFSLILLLCVFIAVVSSAETEITGRELKTSKRLTPYDYLRNVRGSKSCSSGICPFWEQHGRSFVSLRCYAEQYKECTCLHRMCFRSCMFKAEVCNAEMVSCLKQICPRCMPAAEQAMCKTYDTMIDKVAGSFSKFACYPCCPVSSNTNSANGTNGVSGLTNGPMNTVTPFPIITTPPINGNQPGTGNSVAAPGVSQNIVSSNGRPTGNKPGNAVPVGPIVSGNAPLGQVNKPSNVNGAGNGNKPNSVNINNGANKPLISNAVNKPNNANAANAVNRPSNANAAKPANSASNVNAAKPANSAGNVNAAGPLNRPGNINAASTVNRPGNINAASTVNRPGNINAANTLNKPGNVNGANAVNRPNNVNNANAANRPNVANNMGIINNMAGNGAPQLVRRVTKPTATTRRTTTKRQNSNVRVNNV